MKNKTVAAILALALITGSLGSCQSPDEKAKAADNKVETAKEDLKTAKEEAVVASQKAVDAVEWKAFKEETELKISANETRILALKIDAKKAGKSMAPGYESRIDSLESQNKSMEARLANYDKGQTNWEVFKKEFNHDMDGLGKALKDFVVVNKK
jgi:hypothetical protein